MVLRQLAEIMCGERVARCRPIPRRIFDTTSEHVPAHHAERIDVCFEVLSHDTATAVQLQQHDKDIRITTKLMNS